MQILINGEPGNKCMQKRLETGRSIVPTSIRPHHGRSEKHDEEGRTKGSAIGLMVAPCITFINLQYANDTLIFREGEVRQAIMMKWILYYFEGWSGMKINFNKSAPIFLGRRNQFISHI